jgi:tRNA threonylcarbamoyladenosine biosynthesis protein TsaB
MVILAVETSADLCSLAVRDESGTLVERAFRHRMHLLERLIGDVDALLADAGTTLTQIEGLAVGLGPGSFTGVRVGVMAVKTWAATLQKPVCGVSALEAVAQEYAAVSECRIVPVIRARPGTLYTQLFEREAGRLQAQSEPQTLSVPQLITMLSAQRERRCLLCGDGLMRDAETLQAGLGAAGVSATLGRAEAPRASVIAAMAAARLRDGQRDDPLSLTPVYLAPPPIGGPKGEKRQR